MSKSVNAEAGVFCGRMWRHLSSVVESTSLWTCLPVSVCPSLAAHPARHRAHAHKDCIGFCLARKCCFSMTCCMRRLIWCAAYLAAAYMDLIQPPPDDAPLHPYDALHEETGIASVLLIGNFRRPRAGDESMRLAGQYKLVRAAIFAGSARTTCCGMS